MPDPSVIFLVSRQRSGTSVLRQLFASAKNSFDLGEIFHGDTIYKFNFYRFWLKKAKENSHLAHPQYKEHLWNSFISHASAVTGSATLIVDVKIEYFGDLSLGDGRWPIFPVHYSAFETKIVRLRRRNVLAQLISHVVAERTNQWGLLNPNAKADRVAKAARARLALDAHRVTLSEKVEVDPRWVVRRIDEILKEDSEVDFLMRTTHDVYEFQYEDLFDPQGLFSLEVREKCAHIMHRPLSEFSDVPLLKKQARSAIQDYIANAEEVTRHISESPHAWMLSDAAAPTQKQAELWSLIDQATQLEADGRFSEALAMLNRATSQIPTADWLHRARSSLLLKLNRAQEAESAIRTTEVSGDRSTGQVKL